MGKKPTNAFDAFATAKPKAKKSSSLKIAATGLTDEHKLAADLVMANKAKIKQLKAEQDIAERALIDHVYPQQEELARKGTYCKSFTVEGTDGTLLTITTADKWSVSKDANAQEELRKLLDKQFDKYMRMKRTVKLTEDAQEDKKLIEGFIAVAEKHGYTVPEVFEIIDELACQKGMDEDQFGLPKAKLAVFRTICKQYKATVK